MAEHDENGGPEEKSSPVSGAVKIGLFVVFIIIAIAYVVLTKK